MFITVTLDTDNPDAYDQVRGWLEANPSGADHTGRLHPAEVRVTEAVYEGTASRREWSSEYDPDTTSSRPS